MKQVIIVVVTICSLFSNGCNDASKNEATTVSTSDSTSFDLSKARAFVESDNAKFAEEVKKGDSVAVASHYHSDGQVLMSNSEPVMGKDNIASSWGSMIRMGIKDFKIITTDLVGNNDLMVETGKYEIYGDKNVLVDKGKYVVAWKKENGNWKLYRDIGNSSMPSKN